jgi:hypothetical protein
LVGSRYRSRMEKCALSTAAVSKHLLISQRCRAYARGAGVTERCKLHRAKASTWRGLSGQRAQCSVPPSGTSTARAPCPTARGRRALRLTTLGSRRHRPSHPRRPPPSARDSVSGTACACGSCSCVGSAPTACWMARRLRAARRRRPPPWWAPHARPARAPSRTQGSLAKCVKRTALTPSSASGSTSLISAVQKVAGATDSPCYG